jgi:hypothetical protein
MLYRVRSVDYAVIYAHGLYCIYAQGLYCIYAHGLYCIYAHGLRSNAVLSSISINHKVYVNVHVKCLDICFYVNSTFGKLIGRNSKRLKFDLGECQCHVFIPGLAHPNQVLPAARVRLIYLPLEERHVVIG